MRISNIRSQLLSGHQLFFHNSAECDPKLKIVAFRLEIFLSHKNVKNFCLISSGEACGRLACTREKNTKTTLQHSHTPYSTNFLSKTDEKWCWSWWPADPDGNEAARKQRLTWNLQTQPHLWPLQALWEASLWPLCNLLMYAVPLVTEKRMWATYLNNFFEYYALGKVAHHLYTLATL